MGQVIWSQEDRYFRGLCVNELFQETPADNITGNNCSVCLYPFAGTIPEVPCSQHLLPDPTHTYRLQTAASYSLTFDYPEVNISNFMSNTGRSAYMYQGVSNNGLPPLIDWVPVDEVSGEYNALLPAALPVKFNTYDLYWNPASTWQTNIINEHTIPKVGDFIVPKKEYIIDGRYTVRCTWYKSFNFAPVIRRFTVAGTALPHTTESPWHTPAAPFYSFHPGTHVTQSEFIDSLQTEVVLRIMADATSDTVFGWSTARYRVEVYYVYKHQSWRGINPSVAGWQPLRAFGHRRKSDPNYFWGDIEPVPTIPPWYQNVGTVLMYPFVNIRQVYRWESFDYATFMSTTNFVCDRVEYADRPSIPRLEAPLGTKYSRGLSWMRGPAYDKNDGTYRFYASSINVNYYPPSANWVYEWAILHLINSPSSVVVSRLDLTGDSGS